MLPFNFVIIITKIIKETNVCFFSLSICFMIKSQKGSVYYFIVPLQTSYVYVLFHYPHLIVPLLFFVLNITFVLEANDLVHTSPSYLTGPVGAPRGWSYSGCHISGIVPLPSVYQFPHSK